MCEEQEGGQPSISTVSTSGGQFGQELHMPGTRRQIARTHNTVSTWGQQFGQELHMPGTLEQFG